MDYNKFDYILVVDNINEAITDPRVYNRNLPSIDFNPNGYYVGIRDPKISASWAFGKQLQRDLGNLGAEYSCNILDCGGEVAVTITYNRVDTGRSASKSFIIVFDSKSGDGIIKSSSTRWRTISGVSQASSYIRSIANSLASLTSTN